MKNVIDLFNIVRVDKETGEVIGFLSSRCKRWLHPKMNKGRFKASRADAERVLQVINERNKNDRYCYQLLKVEPTLL